MCGRYAASMSTDELVEMLEIQEDHTAEPVRSILKRPQQPPAGQPDYNMAPSKTARVALERGPSSAAGSGSEEPVRQLRLMTWGLVPAWAKDPAVGARMTNARAETLFDKPAYRKAATARRLIVPADGWYEWQASPVAKDAKGKPRKQPFFTRRADGDIVALAGLYEFWRDRSRPDDDPMAWLTTFTIITGPAEPGLDRIHDRQPLVLDRADWAAWLDPDLTDPADVAGLVRSREPGRFEAYPIGREVGSSAANGPGLLRPLERDQLVGVVDPGTGELITG